MKLMYYYIIFVIILLIYGFCIRKIYSLEFGTNKNLNVLLITFITIVLFTLTSIQFNRILSRRVHKIKPPMGGQGYRGIRGIKGDGADNCKCTDSICYKKVMEYITLVYNEWCCLTGYTQIAPTKTINNKFIKQKVKEMCDADTSPFNLLLDRQGSNKFPYYYFVDGLGKYKPCDINNNCGAYDYMFAKWREWILIILKYERGKYFLDSVDLTDIDFNTFGKNGMITENDMKHDTAKRYGCKWKFKNPLIFPNINFSYKNDGNSYDDWFKDYLKKMDPENGDKRIKLYENKKKIFERLELEQTNDPASLERLREAYKDFTLEVSQYLVSLEYFIEYYQKNVAIKNDDKPFFKLSTLKKSSFYDFYNIPGVPSAINCSSKSSQTILSPFDVIRQFDAWYWGAPKLSRPKLINSCEVTENYVKYSDKPQIRLKLSNNYTKIWDNSNIRQAMFTTHDSSNVIIPFLNTGRALVDIQYNPLPHPTINDNYNGVDIFIANNYTDVSEKELKFRYYYPVGCVVVPNNYIKKTDSNKCHPKTASHRDIANILENGPPICTLLVSGDVVEPIGYNRLFIRKRTKGTMKNELGYSFWRPIAPKGYVALGDVISINIDGAPPSTNLIRCIPEYCVEKDFKYSDNTLLDIYTTNSKYNKIEDEPSHISIIYDTDFNPTLNDGNYENINLISNNNKTNPSIDYNFVALNNNNVIIQDIDKFSENYNIFRCSKSNDSITSLNYIQSVKSIFYKIKLETVSISEEEAVEEPYQKVEIITNLYNSKYSILNLYD